jgi:lipopolysaccharide transport protein LptA
MIRQLDVFQQEFYMLKIVLSYRIVLVAVMLLPGYVLSLDENKGETITIRADEAYEDLKPGTLHFKGHFIMQSSEWNLESRQATVHGRLDRPDRVILKGSPARFQSKLDGEKQLVVEAEAMEMEYLRSTNMLELTGGALLKLDEEEIRSKVIKYDIGTRRYWAGGVDGVMIEVLPED